MMRHVAVSLWLVILASWRSLAFISRLFSFCFHTSSLSLQPRTQHQFVSSSTSAGCLPPQIQPSFCSEPLIKFNQWDNFCKTKARFDDRWCPPSLPGLIGVICCAEITQPARPGGHVTRAPVTSPRQRFVKNKQTEGRSPGGAPLS